MIKMKKTLLFILFIILLVFNVQARLNITLSGDINGRDYYTIYGYENITANDYICVAGTCYNSFAGSGTVTSVATDNTYLVGGTIISSGTISLNETLLNATIDARSGTASSIEWNNVTNKPFTGVDTTQGLRILSNILSLNYSRIPFYLNGLFNQTNLTIENSNRIDIINSSSFGNSTLEIIVAANTTGYLIDWNKTGYIKNWNETGLLINWSKIISVSGGNSTEEIINAANTTSYLIDWNATGLLINWSDIIVSGSGNSTIEMINAVNNTALNGSKFTSLNYIYLNPCPDTYGIFYNNSISSWECQSKSSSGGGTVTSVSAGNGMDFISITGSGSVTLGTPDTLSDITTNAVTATSHTHQINLLKDLVAGDGLTGGANNILVGSDSDITISVNAVTAGVGEYTYWDGNSFEARTDEDTTYSAGNGISLATTTFSVAGNTCLDQDSDGLSVTANCIGNTQLEYDTGQTLTTTSTPTFASLSTGQGQYELYAMNQDVETTDAVTFVTVNTGQGANELYDMNQNVLTTSNVNFNSVHTPNYINISGHYQCVNSTDILIFTTNYTKCQS